MANVLAAFLDLIPTSPLLVGEVVATDGSSVRIQLPDGTLCSARGSAEVGTSVYFRAGGVIESDAPALPFFEIEV